ncbi:MAG: hypothetical protein NVSMB38_37300 [Ktedonobacteraceae bacterium]
MTDFFTRLAGRTLGIVPVAQPVIPSMFAPQPLADWKFAAGASIGGLEVEIEQEAATPIRATQAISRPQAIAVPSVQSPRDEVHQPPAQQRILNETIPSITQPIPTPISPVQESASNSLQVAHLEPRVQEFSESRRGIPLQMPSVEPSTLGVSEVMTGASPVTTLHELAAPPHSGVSRVVTGLAPVMDHQDHTLVSESAQDASAPHMYEEESIDSVEIREAVYPQEDAPTRKIQRTFSQRVEQPQDKGNVSSQGTTTSSHASVPIPTITKRRLHNGREQRMPAETIAPVTASSSTRVIPQAAQPQTTEATPATAAFTQDVRLNPSGVYATEMIEISQDIVSKTELSTASARREHSHSYTDTQQPRWDVTQSPASEQQLIVAYDEQQAGARSLQESSRTTPRQVMEQGTSPQQHEEAARAHTEMQSVQVIAHIEHTRTTNNTQHSMEYAQPTTAPTIRVTIGRIDVRAVTSPTPEPKPRTGRQEPKVSLNQYLGRRQ